MKLDKVFQEFTGRETLEITTVTAQADVGGALAGLSFRIHGKDKDGTEYHFQPYFRVGGAGADPLLGAQESDAITFRADVGGNMKSTYFTLHDGPAPVESDRHVYFTVGGAGYDPAIGEQEETTIQAIADVAGALDGCYFQFEDGAGNLHYIWFSIHGLPGVNPGQGLPEISTIQTVDDVAGSLNSTYFTFEDGAGNGFYAWFNVGGLGVDPAVPGDTGLEVAILANDSAATVAAALQAVLDARAEFIATVDGADIVLTNAVSGVAVDIADGAAATGFALAMVQDGIDPVAGLIGAVGIEIPVWTGITAPEIVVRMIDILSRDFFNLVTVSVVPGAPDTMLMVNVTPGAAVDAADGGAPLATGFTPTTTIQGVDALPALAGYTALAAVDVTAADPDEAVAAAFVAAVNGLEGWVAVARAAPNDHIVDLLHPSMGNPTNTADGNIGGAFAVVVTPGVDPDPTYSSIPVDIALNAAAATVAQAIRAAIEVHRLADNVVDCGGVDPDVVITNRWAGTVTDAADVDTGWAIVTTQQGVLAVVTNMIVNVAAADYVVKPDLDETIFLRELEIQLSDGDVTNGALFGALAALANGVLWQVVDRDGVVQLTLTPAIKDNAGLVALGVSNILGTTHLVVHYDLVAAFGGEVPVDGQRGHFFRCRLQDNPNGLSTFYCHARGHVEVNRYQV